MNPKKVLETEDAMCIARAKELMRCGRCKWWATFRWQCEAERGTEEVCYHPAHYLEPRGHDEGCVEVWEPKEVGDG